MSDELGRTSFAITIADTIASWNGRESLVIGVQGKWGSGKSTVKNLVIERLQTLNVVPERQHFLQRLYEIMKAWRRQSTVPDSQILMLSFTPWEWPDPGAIHSAFYAELGRLMGRRNLSEYHKQAADTLRRYADLFDVNSLTEGGTSLGVALLALLAALGVSREFVDNSYIRVFLAVAAFLVGLMALLAIVLKLIASIRSWRAEKYGKTVFEEHQQLSQVMANLPKPIVVFIDEVDRLTSQELRSLFALIKMNANLPNLVFVLFYDVEVVEKELALITQGSARTYLEKVIQLSFTVPAIEEELLAEYLLQGVDHIFSSPGAQARIRIRDEAYDLFMLMRPFIKDLRHAKRFLASLNIRARVFDGEVYEVHPKDLILLEILRLFEPSVYLELAESSDLAVGGSRPVLKDEKIHIIQNRILDKATKREDVVLLINELFPMHNFGEKIDYRGSTKIDESYLYQQARLASYDVFPRYFQLSISESQISFSELEKFFQMSVSRHDVVRALSDMKSQDKIWALTAALDKFKLKIPSKIHSALMGGLFDFADELDDDRGENFFTSPLARIERVLYWIFRDLIPTEVERDLLFRTALDGTNGLYLPSRMTKLLSGSDKSRRLISEKVEEEVWSIFLSRIRDRARSSTLLNEPLLLNLLYRWRERIPVGSNEVAIWVHEMAKQRSSWSDLIAKLETTTIINGKQHNHYSPEADRDFLTRGEAQNYWLSFGVVEPTEREATLLKMLEIEIDR